MEQNKQELKVFEPTSRYFPPLSPEARRVEHSFRSMLSHLDEAQSLEIYEVLSSAHPEYTQCSFEIEGDYAVLTQQRDRIVFPRPLPTVKHFLAATGYLRWLYHKYTLPGFVEIAPGDRVVDCGAYVGGFSLAALKSGAGFALAVEPAPSNHAATMENLKRWPNARAFQLALHKSDGEMTLNLSSSGVEHSFLDPDQGEIVGHQRVTTRRIETLVQSSGMPCDFLKIEAEGVECEIVEGLGDLRPRKIAIDVSPEAAGESPANAITALLKAFGYEMRQRGHVLFARWPGKVAAPKLVRNNNKVIYALWQNIGSSQETRPPLVNIALERWRKLNPNYDICVFDRRHTSSILKRLRMRKSLTSVQAASDLLRHWHLARDGGVWVDASLVPLKPLSAFLPEMEDSSGFAAFQRREMPVLSLATWFLAGNPNSILTTGWWREIEAYWRRERSPLSRAGWRAAYKKDPSWFFDPSGGEALPVYPYFWSHHLFERLVDTDLTARKLWLSKARPSREPAMSWMRDTMSKIVDGAVSAKDGIDLLSHSLNDAPVQKLDQRLTYPDAVIDWLSRL